MWVGAGVGAGWGGMAANETENEVAKTGRREMLMGFAFCTDYRNLHIVVLATGSC